MLKKPTAKQQQQQNTRYEVSNEQKKKKQKQKNNNNNKTHTVKNLYMKTFHFLRSDSLCRLCMCHWGCSNSGSVNCYYWNSGNSARKLSFSTSDSKLKTVYPQQT